MTTNNIAPAANAKGFAKDLVLTGVVRLDGGEIVMIVSRDQSQRFVLMCGETYNGISIAGVAWSDTMGKTRVTLKLGTEYDVIGFDEAASDSGPTNTTTPRAASAPLQVNSPVPAAIAPVIIPAEVIPTSGRAMP